MKELVDATDRDPYTDPGEAPVARARTAEAADEETIGALFSATR
jgi:hypothetical protein